MDHETLAALGISLWAVGGAERARSDALTRASLAQQHADVVRLSSQLDEAVDAIERLSCASRNHASSAHPYGQPTPLCPTCREVIDHAACCDDSHRAMWLAAEALNKGLPSIAVAASGRTLELIAEEAAASVDVDGAPSIPSVLRLRAAALRKLGEEEAAARDLEMAVAMEPDSLATTIALADAAHVAGDWDEELRLVETAIAMGENEAQADWYAGPQGNVFRRRRVTLAIKVRRHEDALRWANEELTRKPGLAWAEMAREKALGQSAPVRR